MFLNCFSEQFLTFFIFWNSVEYNAEFFSVLLHNGTQQLFTILQCNGIANNALRELSLTIHFFFKNNHTASANVTSLFEMFMFFM